MTTTSDAQAAATPSAPTPQFRPRAHFTARDTWLNDPNGLLHHDGVYHLFFQTNPHGSTWGNMSWGHATSTDLVTWDERPVALLHSAEVADTVRTATPSACSAPSAASTCPPSTSSTAASSAVCTRAGDGRSSGVVLGCQRGPSGGSHRPGRDSGGRRQKRHQTWPPSAHSRMLG